MPWLISLGNHNQPLKNQSPSVSQYLGTALPAQWPPPHRGCFPSAILRPSSRTPTVCLRILNSTSRKYVHVTSRRIRNFPPRCNWPARAWAHVALGVVRRAAGLVAARWAQPADHNIDDVTPHSAWGDSQRASGGVGYWRSGDFADSRRVLRRRRPTWPVCYHVVLKLATALRSAG